MDPHLTHGLERAKLLIRLNRLGELTFHDLTVAERHTVVRALRRKLRRARWRSWRARLLAGAVALTGLIMALVAFAAGPSAHIGRDGTLVTTDPLLEAQVWIVSLAVLAVAITAADQAYRRRRRAAGEWASETHEIHAALGRAAASDDR